ncbi:MAG: hypothetical protein WA476_22335 [Acidobacteriaceae bacterium]
MVAELVDQCLAESHRRSIVIAGLGLPLPSSDENRSAQIRKQDRRYENGYESDPAPVGDNAGDLIGKPGCEDQRGRGCAPLPETNSSERVKTKSDDSQDRVRTKPKHKEDC